MENSVNKKEKKNVDYMIKKMEGFLKEKKVTFDKRARNIGRELLNVDISPEQKAKILSLLTTIAIRNGKAEEAKKIGEEALKLEPQAEKKKSIKQKLKVVEQMEPKKISLEELRLKLYLGEIDCAKLNKLVEDNSKTLQGCIFVAEMCNYLRLNELGIKCLKGFKKNNITNLNDNDQKAITNAIEILKIKKPKPIIREKWDRIYEIINKLNTVEHEECR